MFIFSQSEHSDVTSTEFEKKKRACISEVPLRPLQLTVHIVIACELFPVRDILSSVVMNTLEYAFLWKYIGIATGIQVGMQ